MRERETHHALKSRHSCHERHTVCGSPVPAMRILPRCSLRDGAVPFDDEENDALATSRSGTTRHANMQCLPDAPE